MSLSLLAAAATSPDPGSWLVYLGPFLPFGALAVWIILSLQRRIDRLEAQLEAMAERNRVLMEAALPVMTSATTIIARTTERLDKDR